MEPQRHQDTRLPDAAIVRDTLAGYAAANEVTEAERRVALARMSNAEALAIWRDLVSSFNRATRLVSGPRPARCVAG